jgi:L-ascorbate metabolism protein UlaG (beta-lactamase superfamily)
MKLTYHGHSAVKIETNGKTIFIDPFITGNPMTDLKPEDVHVDVILLTHGHNDHVGDTVALAKQNDALVIAPYELATYLSWKGVRTHPMHIGGSFTFEFGKVKLTQAFHGSSYVEENETIIYTGMPSGILFYAEGKMIYHAGDTALFSDMKLIGEMNDIFFLFLFNSNRADTFNRTNIPFCFCIFNGAICCSFAYSHFFCDLANGYFFPDR